MDGTAEISGAKAPRTKAGTANKGGEKRKRFVDVAEKRTVNAIRAIRVIGRLGNPAQYDYTEEDVKKICSTLAREVDAVKVRLSEKTAKGGIEFKLL